MAHWSNCRRTRLVGLNHRIHLIGGSRTRNGDHVSAVFSQLQDGDATIFQLEEFYDFSDIGRHHALISYPCYIFHENRPIKIDNFSAVCERVDKINRGQILEWSRFARLWINEERIVVGDDCAMQLRRFRIQQRETDGRFEIVAILSHVKYFLSDNLFGGAILNRRHGHGFHFFR